MASSYGAGVAFGVNGRKYVTNEPTETVQGRPNLPLVEIRRFGLSPFPPLR